jgi:signal peptidase I
MIPVKTPRGWKPKIPDPGDIIYTPQMKLWSALEDMGYVTTKKVYEMVFVLDQDNKRKISLGLKRVISDLVSLVEVSCVRYIDIKFEPFFCDPCNLEYPHAL